MKARILLAAFLLGAGLCFVPTLGYGEIKQPEKPSVSFYMNEYPDEPHKGLDLWRYDCDLTLPSQLDFLLLQARVNYMMYNPASYFLVGFFYDSDGTRFEKDFPEGVDTKNKIFIWVKDTRGLFAYKTGIALLDVCKKYLEVIYSFIDRVATDMDTDIVAKFFSGEEIPLVYFYQGEYHPWRE